MSRTPRSSAQTGDLVLDVRRGGDDELADFLSALRSDLTVSPPDEVAQRHLAAIMAAAVPTAAPQPVPVRRTWRQRVRSVLGLTAAKVALGAGVAVAATGGLAAGNQLPGPVQDTVSDVASWVGFDLPRAEDRDAGRSDDAPVPDGVPVEPSGPPSDLPTDHGRDETGPPQDGLPSPAPDVADDAAEDGLERRPDDPGSQDANPGDERTAPPSEPPAPPDGSSSASDETAGDGVVPLGDVLDAFEG